MNTIILIILFGIITTINTNSSACENSLNCQCSLTSLDEINMVLEDNIGIEVMVDVLSWDGLEVVCEDTKQLEDFNYSSIPPGKTINSLSIISCVLSDLTSLEKFVKKLGIVESHTFSFQSFKTNNTLLTREHLKGISKVKELILSYNNLSNISSEFFVDFPELEKLDLSHNNFTHFNDIFDATPNLKHLDLNNNNIHSMSSTFFNKLLNLESLDLGYNPFGDIHGSTLNKFVSLKSLSLKANKMSDLSWELFSELKKLESVDISYNSFFNVPQRLFRKNKNLRRIVFDNNYVNLVTLPDRLLTNLDKLEEIHLNNDGLSQLPECFFSDLSSLKYLNFGNNIFYFLLPTIFKGLKNLEVLKINNNLIEIIPNEIFIDLINLKILDLSMNNIDSIPRDLFASLSSLTELNMENNRLKSIEQETLIPLITLSIAKFSNNQLDFLNAANDRSPFHDNHFLKELHLSNNSIEDFFIDWSRRNTLTFLNLSHNIISTIPKRYLHFESKQILVDLSYNKLSNFLIDDIEATAIHKIENLHVIVILDHNPILCDCHLYDLIRYFYNEMHTSVYNYIEIRAKNLTCVYKNGTVGPKIQELDSSTFICPENDYFQIENICQINCTCSVRPNDKTRILDCSNRNFSDFVIDVKNVYMVEGFSFILNLTGNALTKIPSLEPLKLINFTDLLLSNNRISEITIDKLPLNLKVLELHNNYITEIDSNVIKYLNPSYLNQFTLSGNPITCDCDFEDLLLFIEINRHFYEDLNNLKCEHMDIPMYDMNFKNFCSPVLGLKKE
ncbi:hypothetical protein M0802_011862 [Mischocyttarus mexicanus]|nr:hypothetical protein M0802_011862 [Mischocyttarus mexicanus]